MAEWNLFKLLMRQPAGQARGAAPSSVAPVSGDQAQPEVIGRKVLTPDARVINAIGRNHNFQSAVADIVDNSLDAGATKVLVRFIRSAGEPTGLFIVDDGNGMDDACIDRAMTFGGNREYTASDLGHFGVGLKAASLGQARTLTVLSRKQHGPTVGRRLIAENVKHSFECEVLASSYAAAVLDRAWTHLTPSPGTAVHWGDVKIFPRVAMPGAVDTLLDELTEKLSRKLGLVFHRIISSSRVVITIDQEDIASGETSAPLVVQPIDPVGYAKSGRIDYPRNLVSASPNGDIELKCHIWPGRSNDANFRLPFGRPPDFQGFFVYRNDRLLHCGGWHGIVPTKDDLQLARVVVDMRQPAPALFEINPEKTQVEPTDLFKRLVRGARDESVDFQKYLEDATTTYRESRKRVRERPRVLAPGSGFAPSIKGAIGNEYDFIEGRDQIGIRWDSLAEEQFFEVDKEANLIRLNRRYRAIINGGGRGTKNDAPLVKAMLYLLAEPILRGEVLGSRDKDNLAIWQAVLSAAAKAETASANKSGPTENGADSAEGKVATPEGTEAEVIPNSVEDFDG